MSRIPWTDLSAITLTIYIEELQVPTVMHSFVFQWATFALEIYKRQYSIAFVQCQGQFDILLCQMYQSNSELMFLIFAIP
jgi:hypothetical protein